MNVVIAGGGVAALEALMALHDLAGERVAVTVVAPDTQFETRALRTAEPFAVGHVARRSLPDAVAEFGATLRGATLAAVDPGAHEVTLDDGTTLGYDVLLVATGAVERPAYDHALTFGTRTGDEAVNGILADLEARYTRSVAFVAAPGASWPLPLYELAIMTAGQVRSMGIDDAELTLVTPESAPLAAFGTRASDEVSRLLTEAGIAFRGDAYAEIPANGRILVRPSGDELHADRVVSLPVLEGRRIAGLPADDGGFLPIDDHARVRGVDDVYAAGDGTDFPIKQGGLACQQADAAAEEIAVRAGADVTPAPFRPVLRGKLLTGRSAAYLRHGVAGGAGEGSPADHALWYPPTKIAGRYLSRWLAGEADELRDEPGVDVHVEASG